MFCTIKKIKKLYKRGNVCVVGLRGTGKDMLTGNIIARRKTPYISNMDYKTKRAIYIPIDFHKLDVKNNYKTLLSGDIVPYEYPYPEECDIYVSDAGVYFPSQSCNELNKEFANMPVFQALSRHLGNVNFHVNVQNLNRVWDKIREQSDTYIACQSCFVFPRIPFFKWLEGLVIQTVIVYDNYEACLNRVKPFRPLPTPLLNATERHLMRVKNVELHRNFLEKNGSVKRYTFIYRNKTGYDTRAFRKILGGKYGNKE